MFIIESIHLFRTVKRNILHHIYNILYYNTIATFLVDKLPGYVWPECLLIAF